MSLHFLLGLIEIQLAWALRLTFARVLIALEVGVGWKVARELITTLTTLAALVARALAKRMAGLRLELLSDVVLGAATTAAVRIAALAQLLSEFVAAILPEVGHEASWMQETSAGGVPRREKDRAAPRENGRVCHASGYGHLCNHTYICVPDTQKGLRLVAQTFALPRFEPRGRRRQTVGHAAMASFT